MARPLKMALLPVALAALALMTAPREADAQDCTSIKQNTLTTSGCPKTCLSATTPCVLYAPSLAVTKPCVGSATDVAGKCLTQTDFVQPSAPSETCTVTYQCLDGIVTDKKKWLLALMPVTGAAASTTTSAPVTEIKSVTYDSIPSAGVQIAGGATGTKKGVVAEILLDQSFFNTPQVAQSLTLMHVNVRNALETLTISKYISNLYLPNTNLASVPKQLANLNLTILDLSFNYITKIESVAIWKSLTELNLAYNQLTTLPSDLGTIVSLNLTGNPLGVIPDAIFSSSSLKNLYMMDCNLTNVQLTEAQYTKLDQLTTFSAAITVTECGSGFEARDLRSTMKVCFPSSKKESGGGSNTVVIVLCVVGGVVIVGLVVFIALRRRRPAVIDPTEKGPYSLYDGTTGTMGDGSNTGSTIWNDSELLAARIDHREVEAIKLLARGGFGEVWLGLYMGENVAIKRLLSDKKSMNDALQFATEIRLMARLDHPKIVRFIGVSWASPMTIQAVTEFMDCGDLKSLLDSSRSSSLTWANLKCQIAIDVADALVYLHTLSPKMIHRDLKSRNVLIDAQTGAKLSDFGISRDRSVEETMTAGVGTARWIAPEVVLGGHYTESADIYSYGVVLSELDTCKAPFHDAMNTNGAKMQDVTILQLVSAGKLQPSFSDSCPPSILRLARSCLEFDPSRRPTSMQIMYELRNILKNELK